MDTDLTHILALKTNNKELEARLEAVGKAWPPLLDAILKLKASDSAKTWTAYADLVAERAEEMDRTLTVEGSESDKGWHKGVCGERHDGTGPVADCVRCRKESGLVVPRHIELPPHPGLAAPSDPRQREGSVEEKCPLGHKARYFDAFDLRACWEKSCPYYVATAPSDPTGEDALDIHPDSVKSTHPPGGK